MTEMTAAVGSVSENHLSVDFWSGLLMSGRPPEPLLRPSILPSTSRPCVSHLRWSARTGVPEKQVSVCCPTEGGGGRTHGW